MTKTQKLNIIKTTKKEFQSRLKELSSVPLPGDVIDREEMLNRKDSLTQAIHFCNYLMISLKRSNDFKPENSPMLKFIGLEDL